MRKHRLLRAGDRVGVAVSGGADSVALLHLLLALRGELGIVLSVVHFNHQLRGSESDEDQRFVGDLTERYRIPFHHGSGNAGDYAVRHRLSVETGARELRYQWFRRLMQEEALNRIATAHTLDDQAETVILRIARGTGTRGLAGIYPELLLDNLQQPPRQDGRPPAIVRPLLSTTRKSLEAYLGEIGQSWREDQSNRDLHHARNRVRHTILPGLERELNPGIRTVLADTAEIAREEEDYWAEAVRPPLADAWKTNTKGNDGVLRVSALSGLPVALQRRLIRAAMESLDLSLEFRHVEEILALASKLTGEAVLPDEWHVSVQRGELRFARLRQCDRPAEYEYQLSVPGAVEVPQIGSCFQAMLVPARSCEVYNRGHLLDRACLRSELVVRNWRPGDRYWPAHRKEPKKVKELLQERHLGGSEKKLWPVILSGGDLVWMRGFQPPEQFLPRDDTAETVLLQESALNVQNKE
jgi:tRNA(Ile)-lysidine synthase